LNPDFQICHYHLGIINNRLGLYKDAIAEFEKFLKIDKESSTAWAQLGANFYENGDLDKAVNAYSKAVKLNPEDQKSKENLKLLLELQEKFS
jgi:tetratricopeptide (TPR) repeat protein